MDKAYQKGGTVCFLEPSSSLRRASRWLVNHHLFTKLVVVCIVASTVVLMFKEWQETKQAFAEEVFEACMLGVFAFEAVLKIVEVGPVKYIRSPWNVLDFVVVVSGLIDLVLAHIEGFEAFVALRALRSLRPLRLIKRNAGMKLAVEVLIRVIPSLLTMVTMVCLLTALFAIIFCGVYAGKFHACRSANGQLVTEFESGIGNASRPIVDWLDCQGGASESWESSNPLARFDNFAISLNTLIEVASFDVGSG